MPRLRRIVRIGEVFSRWTVISNPVIFVIRGINLEYCRCVCSCGTEKVVKTFNLWSGKSRSCGCLNRFKATHGGASGGKRTSTYVIWSDIKSRCLNPSYIGWGRYGGRGISMCEEWMSFSNFLRDMGERPDGMQLDRIDNNGNYTKDNCRWVTPTANSRNKSNNVIVEFNGERRCIAEWCEVLGFPRYLINSRLAKGWSVERALTTPKVHNNGRRPLGVINEDNY